MKTNKKYLSLMMALVATFTFGFAACSDDDNEEKDMTYPEISSQGIAANPIDCQVYERGSVIPFCYVFTDNQELGNYNIEIHTNADHHSHSTSATECEEDEDHDHEQPSVKPWVFNQDYAIPTGQKAYTARFDIPIPDDIDAGDYHFMIRLTDRAGWQQLKAVAIKVE